MCEAVRRVCGRAVRTLRVTCRELGPKVVVVGSEVSRFFHAVPPVYARPRRCVVIRIHRARSRAATVVWKGWF